MLDNINGMRKVNVLMTMQSNLFAKASMEYWNYKGISREWWLGEEGCVHRLGILTNNLEKKVNKQAERQEPWVECSRFPTIPDDDKIYILVWK